MDFIGGVVVELHGEYARCLFIGMELVVVFGIGIGVGECCDMEGLVLCTGLCSGLPVVVVVGLGLGTGVLQINVLSPGNICFKVELSLGCARPIVL